jgi:hypothetical protein
MATVAEALPPTAPPDVSRSTFVPNASGGPGHILLE